jgi:fructokinase
MSTDAVVIWGELLWDRFSALTSASGATSRATSGATTGATTDQLGGAPANVAWHFGQAGGWARLVTRVGDDADGRRAVAMLEDLVDTSLIQIDPDRATGEVTIELERGEPRFTLHPGRAWEQIACTAAVAEAIHDAGVFVYGTLSQRTAAGFAQWQLAIDAASRALKVYDANLRPNDNATHVVGRALEPADVVKLNDREVAQLRDLLGWDDPVARLRTPEPAGAARHQGRASRSRIVVVTHGAAGSTIYPLGGPLGGSLGGSHGGSLDGSAIEIAGVHAAPGGDNVGCGDAFLALLLYGMTCGWDLATSGRIASRWAAAVAEVRGATPRFDDDRIAELLESA